MRPLDSRSPRSLLSALQRPTADPALCNAGHVWKSEEGLGGKGIDFGISQVEPGTEPGREPAAENSGFSSDGLIPCGTVTPGL